MKVQFCKLDIADWMSDTRVLSLAARGAWLELILNMTARRTDTVSGSAAAVSGIIGCSEDDLKNILSELEHNDIAEISYDSGTHDVYIVCRRLKRETDALKAVKPEKPIYFDYSGDAKIHGITRELLERWKELYPAVDVEQELKSASAWLDANRKNRKSDLKRFLVNWLNKTQDRAKPVPGRTQRFVSREKSENEGWEV